MPNLESKFTLAGMPNEQIAVANRASVRYVGSGRSRSDDRRFAFGGREESPDSAG